MIRSVLSALAMGSMLPNTALACSYGTVFPSALIDAVALYTADYPEPGRRYRSPLDWAQTHADIPDRYQGRMEYTQVRVVNYLYGDGPEVIDFQRRFYDPSAGCEGSQPIVRGQRYVIALYRDGEDWWAYEGPYVVTGFLRDQVLNGLDLYVLPGGEVIPLTSGFEPPSFVPDPVVVPNLPPPLPPPTPQLRWEGEG